MSLSTYTNFILHLKDKIKTKNITIYDQDKNEEIFKNLCYIDGNIQDDLKMMEHPLETGANITDHIIDDAKKGTIQCLIYDDDSSSLNEILECFRNRTQLIVKIKNEVFTDLCISSKPVKADIEHYNSTVYELGLKEVQWAQTVYVKMSVPQVKNKKNASTVKTGQKQPQKPKKQVSILAKMKKKLNK